MTATLPDLTGCTDEELAALCAGADEDVVAAVIAEGERRDTEALAKARAEAASRAAKARYDADKREWWAECVEPDYAAAEARCTGNLLSRRGEREGIEDPRCLWLGREDLARARASEELNAHWDEQGGRPSFSAWRRQRGDMARVQRADIEGEDMDAADSTAAGADTLGQARAAATQRSATFKARQADRERRRIAAGQRAGITPAPRAEVATRPASAVATQAPQIDGAALLNYTRAFVTKYTHLTPAQADAVAVWIGHTHLRDGEGFLSVRCSPRLYALSSQPGSGKSTLLEHLGRLCPATFGLDTEPSEAGLVYSISKEHATILLDEADVLFGSGKRKQAVRAVINAGYMPNGTVLKVRGGKGERVRIYGALALAGLDVMEKATNGVLDALLSRGVIIRMKRAPEDHDIPEMTRTDEANAAKLRLVLEKWGTANRDEIADLDVDVPDGIRNRQAQIWKTLLRVGAFADLSHKRARNDPDAVPPGGSWYDRAWDACEALALAGADDDADRTAQMMDELGAEFGALDMEG